MELFFGTHTTIHVYTVPVVIINVIFSCGLIRVSKQNANHSLLMQISEYAYRHMHVQTLNDKAMMRFSS